MKTLRNLSLLVCAVAISMISFSDAQAQYARAGIKGGLNLSNLYVNDTDEDNARIGWHAGFYGRFSLTS